MKTTTTILTTFKYAIILVALVTVSTSASAAPKLDGVSFDPAFISAGDRINISANIHEPNYPDRVWNEDRKLKVVLRSDNRLTREYVTIEDERDDSIGFLYPEGVWNQRFQVKVDSGAPTGMYDFKLEIQYLENGKPVKIKTDNGESNLTIIRRFSMPVDREGVDLSSNVVETEPSVLRPGQDYAETLVRFTNTGNKPVEEIEVNPSEPEGIQASYSTDQKFFINRLAESQSSEKTITFDINEHLSSGVHSVNLSTTYEDESGNVYTQDLEIPLRVEGKADLELQDSRIEMKAGETSELRLTVNNSGEQDAESVTARVIAERTQPFSLEDRSNYLGEIEAGESVETVMKLSADREGSLKQHQLKIQLRATGDSEEGDHSVYTFTDQAEIVLTGKTEPPLLYLGLASALLLLVYTLYRYRPIEKLNRSEGGEENE